MLLVRCMHRPRPQADADEAKERIARGRSLNKTAFDASHALAQTSVRFSTPHGEPLHACALGLEGHRVQAAGRARQVRPEPHMAEDQEPELRTLGYPPVPLWAESAMTLIVSPNASNLTPSAWKSIGTSWPS